CTRTPSAPSARVTRSATSSSVSGSWLDAGCCACDDGADTTTPATRASWIGNVKRIAYLLCRSEHDVDGRLEIDRPAVALRRFEANASGRVHGGFVQPVAEAADDTH